MQTFGFWRVGTVSSQSKKQDYQGLICYDEVTQSYILARRSSWLVLMLYTLAYTFFLIPLVHYKTSNDLAMGFPSLVTPLPLSSEPLRGLHRRDYQKTGLGTAEEMEPKARSFSIPTSTHSICHFLWRTSRFRDPWVGAEEGTLGTRLVETDGRQTYKMANWSWRWARRR